MYLTIIASIKTYSQMLITSPTFFKKGCFILYKNRDNLTREAFLHQPRNDVNSVSIVDLYYPLILH